MMSKRISFFVGFALAAQVFFSPYAFAAIASKEYVDRITSSLESINNKVSSTSAQGGQGITNSSTDAQYPSAKAVWDLVNAMGGASSIDPEWFKTVQVHTAQTAPSGSPTLPNRAFIWIEP